MSNSLTLNKLEEIILEVLQERVVNIADIYSDYPAIEKAVYGGKRFKELGDEDRKNAIQGVGLRQLAGQAGSKKELTKSDYEAAKSKKYLGMNASEWTAAMDLFLGFSTPTTTTSSSSSTTSSSSSTTSSSSSTTSSSGSLSKVEIKKVEQFIRNIFGATPAKKQTANRDKLLAAVKPLLARVKDPDVKKELQKAIDAYEALGTSSSGDSTSSSDRADAKKIAAELKGQGKNKWKERLLELIENGKANVAEILLPEYAKAHYGGVIDSNNATAIGKVVTALEEIGVIIDRVIDAEDTEEEDEAATDAAADVEEVLLKLDKDLANLPDAIKRKTDDLEYDKRSLSPFGDMGSMSDYVSDDPTGATSGAPSVSGDLLATFRTLEGDNLATRMADLFKTADLLVEAKEDPSVLDSQDPFKLASHFDILLTLFNLPKEFDETSGGTIAERLVAAIIEGWQTGASQGAIDAAAYLARGKTFWTSMKFLAQTNLSQSMIGQKPEYEGINWALSQGPIYYVYGYKLAPKQLNLTNVFGDAYQSTMSAKGKGQGKSYGGIALYLIKVARGTGTDITMQAVNSKGELVGEATVDEKNAFGDEGTINAWKKELKPYPLATLPLLDSSTTNPDVVANAIQDRIDDSSNDILQAITKIYRRLQNLQKNTREYNASKATATGRTGTGISATEYIKAISTDYKDIKDDYKKVFTKGGGSTANTAFNESKFKNLDQLIAETIREIKTKRKK